MKEPHASWHESDSHPINLCDRAPLPGGPVGPQGWQSTLVPVAFLGHDPKQGHGAIEGQGDPVLGSTRMWAQAPRRPAGLSDEAPGTCGQFPFPSLPLLPPLCPDRPPLPFLQGPSHQTLTSLFVLLRGMLCLSTLCQASSLPKT